MLETALESLLRETTDARRDLEEAREEFHRRAGAFSSSDAFYEERILAFFDWYLCEWAVSALPRSDLGLACRGATRGLYRVTKMDADRAWLEDLLSATRWRLPRVGAAERLQPDDVLDGRLLVHEGAVRLAPGALFHPAEAREAITALAARARTALDSPREVLDGLLRIRMRLVRFTHVRARHVYRYEALRDTEILSATWARRDPKHASNQSVADQSETVPSIASRTHGAEAPRSEDP